MLKSLLLITIAVLLMSGCADMVQKPQVKVVSIRYAIITKHSQEIGVRLAIHNPNDFSIPIQKGSANITVEGQRIGKGVIPRAIKLPADGSVQITIPLQMNVALLKSDLPEILLEGKVSYLISGKVMISSRGHTYYPFTYKGTLNTSEAEKIIKRIA
ncbi:LEA type 2 family protein [Acidithiobacillus concretivorus]|uniref:Water stress and hypersensitive response domain-containing protein n=1 Tax=Acidithiobacillus concretivorus TaxID=3063952 RepID=A0ABS5ZM28_9PROT|nr:LEA type 2 family protein [Acidithiobacillus concretivorus]MBU2737709.1 hypothetical protein [Acidithiobacillus concretivorus]